MYMYNQSFPSGLLNEGPNDSQCGVKGSLIMIQGFVVLKRLKLLPKYRQVLPFKTRNTSNTNPYTNIILD